LDRLSFVRELCRAADAYEVAVSDRSSAEDVVVSGASSVKDVVVSASSSVPSGLLSSESVSYGNSSSVLSRQVSVVLPSLIMVAYPLLHLVWTHVSPRSNQGAANYTLRACRVPRAVPYSMLSSYLL